MDKNQIIASVVQSGKSNIQIPNVKKYLSKLGYLKNIKDLDDTRLDISLEEGIRRYQGAHGIDPTGMIDLSTIELLNTPRCGVPDFGGYDYIGCKWNKNHLKWHLSNGGRTISHDSARQGLREAFDVWAQVCALTFEEVASSSQADLPAKFASGDHGDNFPFDTIGKILAHAFYPPNCGGAFSGHIHFDDAEDWSTGRGDAGTDFVTVAIHEIGHSLGLNHEMKVKAIMNPNYVGRDRKLYDDDIRGIQAIYGKKN